MNVKTGDKNLITVFVQHPDGRDLVSWYKMLLQQSTRLVTRARRQASWHYQHTECWPNRPQLAKLQ